MPCLLPAWPQQTHNAGTVSAEERDCESAASVSCPVHVALQINFNSTRILTMQQNIQEVFCNVWSAMSEKCRNTWVCCQMAEEKDYQRLWIEAVGAKYVSKCLKGAFWSWIYRETNDKSDCVLICWYDWIGLWWSAKNLHFTSSAHCLP